MELGVIRIFFKRIVRALSPLILATFALFAAGCTTSLPINYVPSASIRGEGPVSVGMFKYVPADQGSVGPDEFQKATGALGNIHLSQPVPDLFRTAVRKELVAGGYSVEPGAAVEVSGNVTRFLYDWIGIIEVDFYLDVTFTLRKNGETVLIYNTSSHQKAPKTMMQDTEAVRAAISDSIDQFFMEARSKKLL
jgi:uncharacterized lipoprotein YajG